MNEQDKPTKDYHEQRLQEARQARELCLELERSLLYNLTMALQVKEYHHAEVICGKLRDNQLHLASAEISIRQINDDIELDTRMGIY